MIDRIIDLLRETLLRSAAVVAGCYSLTRIPVDALPDLGDTQVIVYSRWDRSPDIIEDQVTYPIVTALSGAPRVNAVRGLTDFGYSYVYVIFAEGTDLCIEHDRERSNTSLVSCQAYLRLLRQTWVLMSQTWVGHSNMSCSMSPVLAAWRNCESCRIGSCDFS